MTLRVLHVIPRAPGGGTSGFTQRQIDQLCESGIDGRVVFFSGSEILAMPCMIPKEIIEIRQEIRTFKPNIIHAHWGSLLAFVTAIASTGLVPYVITFRGSDINPVPSEPRLFGWVRFICSQLAALGAAANIFVSDELQKKLWFRRGTLRTIPDGTDITLFRPLDRNQCRQILRWEQEDQVILFHEGGRPKVKRRDLAEAAIIEARRHLRSCRLEVLGSNVPHDQVPILLNASDCLLVTSDYEGSPNIVREALACSTPIVSVPVGDIRKWLKGIEGTKIVSRDPVEIGSALAEVITNRIRPSASMLTMQFSMESTIRSILEIYNQVLGDSKR